MRLPRLADLPPPPPGKTGWPWTEASPSPVVSPAPGGSWPRISVVTPSFNHAPFLEETIRSVLLQGYPDLEYIVMDGGSNDESVEIVRRYEAWIAHWVSERDDGQAHAINKGLDRASGQIFAWLNSDDLYEPGALHQVGAYFANESCDLVYGDGWHVDEDGLKTSHCEWIRPFDRKLLLTFNFILQPAAFWRRALWECVGPLDSRYHYAMDWEWLIRATRRVDPCYLPVDLARWRIGPEIKTRSGGWARRAEIADVARRYGGMHQPTYIVYHLDRIATRLNERYDGTVAGRAIQRVSAPLRRAVKDNLWNGRYLS